MFVPSDADLPGLITALESAAAAVASGLDPDAVPGCEATGLYERLDRVGRVVGGARTVLARRVAEAAAWKATAHQSAAEHLAALSGSSIGAARDELATSAALTGLPEVRDGMLSGVLSGAQGSVIADAGRHAPDAAAGLVAAAQRTNLNDLRDQAGRAKAAADADAARHARIHAERRCSRSTRSDGTFTLYAQGTPEDGALIAGMLDREIDRLYRSSGDPTERASRDALAWDALVAIARRHGQAPTSEGTEPKDNPRFLSLIRVDATALQRGTVADGELCEITGIGPVPVTTARRLLGDSVLKLVLTRGVDVANVTHLGRGPSAAQKIALAWTSPTCTVEGCTRTHTEYDHRIDWADTHHTRLDETDPLCDGHHDKKTHHGWALVNGTGKRPMVPPDHPDHPGRQRTTAPPGRPTPAGTLTPDHRDRIQAVIDHLSSNPGPATPAQLPS